MSKVPFFSLGFVLLLSLVVLFGSCEKEDDSVCEPQDFTLQQYPCLKLADSSYIIQSQAELDSFYFETASDIADCIFPLFEVDFNTQTLLAYYTVNCGNTLEVCLEDEEILRYNITTSPILCISDVMSYNVIAVDKVNSNQSVVFSFE